MQNVHWGVHGAVAGGVNASVLLIGDSWFWYPVDNLVVEIGAKFPQNHFVVVGKNGAEASQWSEKYRKDIDFGFKKYGDGVQALMLSGGGNDVAGMADFLRILQDDCGGIESIEGCYRAGQPDAIISKIMGAYRELIIRFRAYNSHAPVIMHNYDYAWPTGKGLFGPADWLKSPMDRAKVPEDLRRDFFKDLLNRLHEAQLRLGEDASLGPLIAIKSAGTMPELDSGVDQWWADELHPTPKGFKLIAKKAFIPELKNLPLV